MKTKNYKNYKNIKLSQRSENILYTYTSVVSLILVTIFIFTLFSLIPNNQSTSRIIKTTISENSYKPKLPIITDASLLYQTNFNKPTFSDKNSTNTFVEYSNLDTNNRPTMVYACIDSNTENIDTIESEYIPKGFNNNKKYNGTDLYKICPLLFYDVGGKYIPENLITITEYSYNNAYKLYMNTIKEYIDQTNNHILLRIRPFYNNNDTIPYKIQIEAYSVEDSGYGLQFNISISNIDPDININYTDGTNERKT